MKDSKFENKRTEVRKQRVKKRASPLLTRRFAWHGVLRNNFTLSEKNEQKALDDIVSSVNHENVCAGNFESCYSRREAKTVKEAWDIMNKAYRGADKVKLQSLRRHYELLSMNDQETIIDYFTRIQVLINSMKAYSEKYLDEQIIDKVWLWLQAVKASCYEVTLSLVGLGTLQRMNGGDDFDSKGRNWKQNIRVCFHFGESR
ncbi:hypothetical protein CR513_10248, partial [Mucuna pruriens]